MEPPLRVDRFRRPVGEIVVALHDLRTPYKDLSILGDAFLRARDRPAHCPYAEVAREVPHAVDVQHGTRLGQAIAFENRQPRSEEEPVDLGRERRAATHEELEATAHRSADLAKEDPVGNEMPEARREIRLVARESHVRPPEPRPDRPLDDPALEPPGRPDRCIHLLVEAGDRDGQGRPDFLQVLRNELDGAGIGDRTPDVEEEVVRHPLEDVRQRKEGEGRIRLPDRDDSGGHEYARVEVAVRKHDALRIPRRARRIEDRRDILRPGPLRLLAEVLRRLPRIRPGLHETGPGDSAGGYGVGGIEHHDGFEPGAFRPDLLDLPELSGIRYEREPGP